MEGVCRAPGEVLMQDYLKPRGISMYRLAKAIGRPQSAVSGIVHGRRAVTPEMSCLLSAALGTEPDYWAELEVAYQVERYGPCLASEVKALV